MITAENTTKEVYQYLIEHQSELYVKGAKAEFQWQKKVREAKGRQTSMLAEFECAGNIMYQIRHTDSAKGCLYNYVNLVLCPVANDKFHFLYWKGDSNEIFKYTTHFFERYKERMKLKGNIKNAIKTYFRKATCLTTIYRNELGHRVWQTPDGLVLGLYNKDTDMDIACTFVDFGLLKPSQRAAFKVAEANREQMLREYDRLGENGVATTDAQQIISEKHDDVQKAAQEVYGLFFETKDLRLRN